MRIKQYGVTLRRVEKRDIELIRRIRNSNRIRNNMLFKEHITKEMQLNWFKSIEKDNKSIYLIIIHKQKKIGLINSKYVNNEFSESGLFLFSEEYYKTNISIIASIIMLSSSFYALNRKTSTIRVLKNNKTALNYNQNLGYKITDEKENYYILENTINSFESKTKNIRKAIKNIYGNSKLEFIAEPIDFSLNLAKSIKKDIANIPPNILIKKTEKQNYIKLVLNLP
jgi:RimJ/RimL family protein N-acetyltransferase